MKTSNKKIFGKTINYIARQKRNAKLITLNVCESNNKPEQLISHFSTSQKVKHFAFFGKISSENSVAIEIVLFEIREARQKVEMPSENLA